MSVEDEIHWINITADAEVKRLNKQIEEAVARKDQAIQAIKDRYLCTASQSADTASGQSE